MYIICKNLENTYICDYTVHIIGQYNTSTPVLYDQFWPDGMLRDTLLLPPYITADVERQINIYMYIYTNIYIYMYMGVSRLFL